MAFVRPTLQQLIDRARSDARTELGVKTALRRTFVFVLAKIAAGLSHMLHGHLQFISKQISPLTATLPHLRRLGKVRNVTEKAATKTQINIDVVFTAADTLAAGVIYQREDGVEYTVNLEVVAGAAGTFAAVITASIVGADSNTEDTAIISLQSALANIETDATVSSTKIEGENPEAEDDYRSRVVSAYQETPVSGNNPGYVALARTVAGVTRAWVTPGGMGEGTITVYIVEDNETPIIPNAAKIQELEDLLFLEGIAHDEKFAAAPIPREINPEISITPNTLAVRTAVSAELENLLLRQANVAGTFKEVNVKNDGVIKFSELNEAISIAPGEDDHVLTSPVTNVVPLDGELVILGTPIFTTLES